MSTKFDKLEQLLSNIEKLDWNPEAAVRDLSTIADVKGEIAQAKTELANITGQCVTKTAELATLNDRSGEAAANLDNINKATADAQLNLDGILQKAEKESDRIEFAENTLLLYEDPSQITPWKFAELDVMLQKIIEAKFDVSHLGCPIDYKSLKDKAVLLLEQAVGKSLVPRELLDDVINRFGRLTNDLLFDRLSKMEKDKSDLTAMKREISQLSIEKTTKVALGLQAKGDIRVHRCKGCQSTTAFSPASGIFCKNIWTCPVCNTTNPTAAIDT